MICNYLCTDSTKQQPRVIVYKLNMRIIIKILTLLILAIFVGSITAQRGKGSSTPTDLTGTSWQLVKPHNSDGETVTPDDKSKYTMTFGANGHATVRADCNRRRGPW